jgi:hypothetical protein
MTFDESKDWDLIRSIVTHPSILPHLQDDFAKDKPWEPIDHPTVHYRLIKDGDEVIGLFIVCTVSPILWLIHQMFLPCAYGFRSKRAGREFAEWGWKNTEVQRVIGEIVESNTLALRYAKQAGWIEYGRNPKAMMKDGRLQDIVLVGMSRPEELCHS